MPLRFEPRGGAGYSSAGLADRIVTDPVPYGQCLAALGLSWRERVASGQPIDLPVLDLGPAIVLLLPGETYVEYQCRPRRSGPMRSSWPSATGNW